VRWPGLWPSSVGSRTTILGSSARFETLPARMIPCHPDGLHIRQAPGLSPRRDRRRLVHVQDCPRPYSAADGVRRRKCESFDTGSIGCMGWKSICCTCSAKISSSTMPPGHHQRWHHAALPLGGLQAAANAREVQKAKSNARRCARLDRSEVMAGPCRVRKKN